MSAEPTTPDLAALTRRSFASASRRDWDAVMSQFAPDAVWDARELHTFEGEAASRGLVEDWTYSAVHVWRAGASVSIPSYNEVDEARAAGERLAESRG